MHAPQKFIKQFIFLYYKNSHTKIEAKEKYNVSITRLKCITKQRAMCWSCDFFIGNIQSKILMRTHKIEWNKQRTIRQKNSIIKTKYILYPKHFSSRRHIKRCSLSLFYGMTLHHFSGRQLIVGEMKEPTKNSSSLILHAESLHQHLQQRKKMAKNT